MSNDERNPNDEIQRTVVRLSSFGLRVSSFFRYSTFVIWILALTFLLNSGLIVFAQRQPEQRPPPLNPAQAESEARTLVAEMLSQKPAQTNTGLLKIRDANGVQRELPMRFETWSTASTSTS